jgi:hypothetical protein
MLKWLESPYLRTIHARYSWRLVLLIIPVHSIVVPGRCAGRERRLSALTWRGLDARVQAYLAARERMRALASGGERPRPANAHERAAAMAADPGARVRTGQRERASVRARVMINS